MVKGKAIITVSYACLKEALGLPNEVEIRGVLTYADDRVENRFSVKLWGDNLPEVEEGSLIPTISMQEVKRRYKI